MTSPQNINFLTPLPLVEICPKCESSVQLDVTNSHYPLPPNGKDFMLLKTVCRKIYPELVHMIHTYSARSSGNKIWPHHKVPSQVISFMDGL